MSLPSKAIRNAINASVVSALARASPSTGGGVKSKSSRRRTRKRAQGGAGSGTVVARPSGFGTVTPGVTATVNGRRSTVICHREYLADVQCSEQFRATSYALNPGLRSTFPWLYSIASQYELYKIRRFRVLYQNIAATATVGSIYLAVDLDAADSTPDTKQVMMDYQHSVRCSVWQPWYLEVGAADLQRFVPQRFTRSGLVTGSDLKTYDFGILHVATAHSAVEVVDSTVGELYLEYEIELFNPQIEVHPELRESASVVSTSNNRAAPFTGAAIAGKLPISVSDNGTSLLFNTVGEFLGEMFLNGTDLLATKPTVVQTDGLSTISDDNVVYRNATNTFGKFTFKVDVKEPGAKVEFDLTPSLSTVVGTSLRLASYASGLF